MKRNNNQNLIWIGMNNNPRVAKNKTDISLSIPDGFKELMGPKYWEHLLKKNNAKTLLREWLLLVSAAMLHKESLYDMIGIYEDNEIEEELIGGSIFEELSELSEEGNSRLECFGDKESDLRKQKKLTNLSFLDFASWCIKELRGMEGF